MSRVPLVGAARAASGWERSGREICPALGLALLLVVEGLAVVDRAEAQVGVPRLATGLARPTAIAHAGDGSGRLFIALQEGQIVIWDGTEILSTPFLSITTRVSCCGERGLLGLAFHPRYAENGFFYVNYTDNNGNTVIARYRVSANADVADRASESVRLRVTQPASNHNGGQLQFGPDGYLYIGLGDGGGTPGTRSQSLGTLLGKILRIDVDGPAPYGIPTDNPFRGVSGALPEIWALGLRNPWRFSFDRVTGDLFIADVGEGRREEVNFEPGTSAGGRNYGWPRMEGSLCFSPLTGCNQAGLILPIAEYPHNPECSVTGGYRYRGTRFPELLGTYFYADFCSGRIWGATRNASGAWVSTERLNTELNPSAFGEDEEGELYLLDYNATAGALHRLVGTTPPAGGEIILDNAPVGAQNGGRSFTGTWCRSTAAGHHGADSLFSCGSGSDTYRFNPPIPSAGLYDVFIRWTSHPNRSTSVPVSLIAGSTTTRTFNQRTGGGAWVSFGRFNLAAGSGTQIRVSDASGQASADAVRLVRVTASASEVILDNAPSGVQDAAGGRTFTGTWCGSSQGGFGGGSLYSCGSGADRYRFTPPSLAAGPYDVYVRWTSHENRSASVPVSVVTGTTTTRTFNQRTAGGAWTLHGRYTVGSSGIRVEISDANGQASADAVRFVRAP
ncbi:MAG: PQQ-dependent sugar dehydrogenase [Candidatus Rokubacteria bacterium]|nr:PQQ-dependent sugar dehydrogenase [Candidatus Rokubacteria bacterium]